MTYRLTIAGVDWSCDALRTWRVAYGRADADSQPDVGQGQWTLVADNHERFPDVAPGAPLLFEANAGGQWLPVATMRVSRVSRAFEWAAGLGARNRITVDAVGPREELARVVMPVSDFAVNSEHSDAYRVLQCVTRAGLEPTYGRQQSNHDINDRLPADASSWQTWQGDADSSWSLEFTRDPVTVAPPSDMEWRFTSDGPVLARVGGPGAWVYHVFDAAGDHILQHAPTGSGMPRLQFTVYDAGMAVQWTDPTPISHPPGQWTDVQPPDLPWGFHSGKGTVHVQLTDFDAWSRVSSWDLQGDTLINRVQAPESQTYGAHVDEVAASVRGALWETRGGGVVYTNRFARNPAATPAMVLDSCQVLAASTGRTDLSEIVNEATQFYGYDPPPDPDTGVDLPRLSVSPDTHPNVARDDASVAAYGRKDRSDNGPIRDESSAIDIVRTVVQGHRQPHERVERLTLLPFDELPAQLVVDLLSMPPSSVLEVSNTPRGWVASPNWWGWVEGTSITGSQSGVVMELQVSEFVTVTGSPPAAFGLSAARRALPPAPTVGGGGSVGPPGPEGPAGEAATVQVGSTTTGAAGTDAAVVNSGDQHHAVLEFTIPQGAQGPRGQGLDIKGAVASATDLPDHGNHPGDTYLVTADGDLYVWDGSGWNDVGHIQGPVGPPGAAGVDGQSATIVVGPTTTGAAGSDASVVNTGTATNARLQFTIPRGADGARGSDGVDGAPGATGPRGPMGQGIRLEGAVDTPADLPTQGNQPGDTHLVTSTGDLYVWDGNQWNDTGHVQGPEGPAGADGAAATVQVGRTTTGQPGSLAAVANSGTTSHAVLDFQIPRGEKGDPGSDGRDGAPGATGPRGPAGTGIRILGAVATPADLPPSGNSPGDTHLVTSTGDLYVWDGAAWQDTGHVQGPEGPPGRDGADGAAGAAASVTVAGTITGAAGSDASVSNVGSSSDAKLIFQIPRGAAGAPGAPGATGPRGPRGQGIQILGAVATPADLPTSGNSPGDTHLVTSTGDLYVWDGAAWQDTGHVQGPEGPPGADGSPGSPGPAGADGSPGPTAVSADCDNRATLGSDSLIHVPRVQRIDDKDMRRVFSLELGLRVGGGAHPLVLQLPPNGNYVQADVEIRHVGWHNEATEFTVPHIYWFQTHWQGAPLLRVRQLGQQPAPASGSFTIATATRDSDGAPALILSGDRGTNGPVSARIVFQVHSGAIDDALLDSCQWSLDAPADTTGYTIVHTTPQKPESAGVFHAQQTTLHGQYKTLTGTFVSTVAGTSGVQYIDFPTGFFTQAPTSIVASGACPTHFATPQVLWGNLGITPTKDQFAVTWRLLDSTGVVPDGTAVRINYVATGA